MIPGETLYADGDIELNPGRPVLSLEVTNTGDRAIQIGSHFHFFEVNRALQFARASTFGMRLDIPSGTAVRFEAGQTHRVDLVPYGGSATIIGFNALTNGEGYEAAAARARAAGFDLGLADGPVDEGQGR